MLCDLRAWGLQHGHGHCNGQHGSIPLVIISGQVATPLIGRDSFQEADISGITTPITKHNYLVKDAKELPRVLKEAFYIASTGRPGPVLVDIAKDVFDTSFDFEYPEEVHLRGYKGNPEGCEDDVARAVQALAKAKRPVLLTGGGVVLSGMADTLRSIVQQLGVPVVTTLMGKGSIPDQWDCHLGMVGMHGSYAANMAVTQCDLLLAVGARLMIALPVTLPTLRPRRKSFTSTSTRLKSIKSSMPISVSTPIFAGLCRTSVRD